MTPIQIHLGEENRIFIEKDVLHSPLFAEQYEQLINKITEYFGHKDKSVEPNNYSSKNENNIFLINGERGAGKTSMLASIREYFGNSDAHGVQTKAFRLGIIDPSSFSNNANILQIIIAELFKEFKNIVKTERISYAVKNEITNIFVQIKHALCVLESVSLASKMDDSDIESLQDMSKAIELEYLISELIGKMLKTRDEQVLLVSIDDIDLNTTYAYEMLEQIRKYLILPNVVVIIAAKYNQLLDVVQQHNLREYGLLVSNGVMNTHDVLEMSNKYILKLFPLEHRINLNTAIHKFQQPIEVYENDKVVVSASNGDELIYKLIYQKTGLQFLLERDGVNYVVPNNLRAFRFLVKMLCDMDAVQKEFNINVYQHYFLSEWVIDNLPLKERTLIYELLEDSDVSKVNKKIILSIMNSMSEGNYPQNIPYPEIIDKANIYSNVSLGDVIAIMLWSKSVNSSEQHAKYMYAIKHAYTILMEKSYRAMLNQDSINKKIVVYNNSHADEYMNAYQRLIGGALLNGYSWDYLLPSANSSENRLHRRVTTDQALFSSIPDFIKCLIVTPYRSKEINEGEAYRKQMSIYYLQTIHKNTKDVIIDCFNFLYTIPFYMEQMSRFENGELTKWNEYRNTIEIYNRLTDKQNVDETKICMSFFKLCIHSMDLLERIYWQIRINRNFLRTTSDRLGIYKRLLFVIGKTPIDEYIEDSEKKNFNNLIEIAIGLLLQDSDTASIILEGVSNLPHRKIGFPELSTIANKCRTVAALKMRMRQINIWKGYSAEWIDSEIDKLGFTDEELQNLDPRTIRDRLKRIGR